MSADAEVQEGWSVEHTEDCPAERGDCTCGGYVPHEVAERLAEALEGIDNTKTSSNPVDLDFAVTLAMETLAEFRAVFPKAEEA